MKKKHYCDSNEFIKNWTMQIYCWDQKIADFLMRMNWPYADKIFNNKWFASEIGFDIPRSWSEARRKQVENKFQ